MLNLVLVANIEESLKDQEGGIPIVTAVREAEAEVDPEIRYEPAATATPYYAETGTALLDSNTNTNAVATYYSTASAATAAAVTTEAPPPAPVMIEKLPTATTTTTTTAVELNPAPTEMQMTYDERGHDDTIKPGDLGPEEKWSHGLCSCCEQIFQPLFWMACCCTPLVYGQLMQRTGLDWCGSFDPSKAANTFGTVAVIFIVYLTFNAMGIGEAAGVLFLIYCLIIYTKTRGAIRRKYRIPSKTCHCCDGGMEDCCVACWCSCCSSIQMARHTHNEERYVYQPCSPTGLPTYAP